MYVLRSLAFIDAHQKAQELFYSETYEKRGNDELSVEARVVLQESEAQVSLAENLLRTKDPDDVCTMISHLFCTILLNKIGRAAEKLQTSGVLKEREARPYMENVEEGK